MASQLELSARAALCRQLAKREPTNRVLWMAEAENWSRLSNEKLRGEAEQKWGPHLGEFAGAFRKIVYQSRRSKSRAKRGPRMHGPQNATAQGSFPSKCSEQSPPTCFALPLSVIMPACLAGVI